ncbi:MAG: tetratricopeptide repeat protein [Elusimicrobia bacterium]|nr:tetratricopeptide repeat protein [Elusimicrobiota bacterium]
MMKRIFVSAAFLFSPLLVFGWTLASQQQYALGNRDFAFERYEESAQHFEKSLESDPSNEESLTMAGWSYFKMGRYDNAREKFKSLLEQDPKSKDALEGLGWIYFKQGYFRDSSAVFLELHEKDRSRGGAIEGVAYNYFKLGDLENAKKYLKMALLENPRSADSHLIFGYVATAGFDYPLAICSFKKAIALTDPVTPSLWDTLGWSYVKAGNKKCAERAFNRALKLDPNFSSSLTGLREAQILQ